MYDTTKVAYDVIMGSSIRNDSELQHKGDPYRKIKEGGTKDDK